MFLLRKRKRRNKKSFNLYYLVSAVCLCIGIAIGYLNANTSSEYLIPAGSDPVNVFKYSIIKNSILLILIFINSFSVIGFPLTAATLVISGYFITVSTAVSFLNYHGRKVDFIIRSLPQTALVITALFLLSEAVFRFSHYIFTVMFRAGYKNGLIVESKHVFFRLFLSLTIILISAAYEAFVL